MCVNKTYLGPWVVSSCDSALFVPLTVRTDDTKYYSSFHNFFKFYLGRRPKPDIVASKEQQIQKDDPGTSTRSSNQSDNTRLSRKAMRHLQPKGVFRFRSQMVCMIGKKFHIIPWRKRNAVRSSQMRHCLSLLLLFSPKYLYIWFISHFSLQRAPMVAHNTSKMYKTIK